MNINKNGWSVCGGAFHKRCLNKPGANVKNGIHA